MLAASACFVGRSVSVLSPTAIHYVTKNRLLPPYPAGLETVAFGMGCFWCAEALFASSPGIYVTLTGYSQGVTSNPSYEEVCSGRTNHSEVVQVVYDPAVRSFRSLLKEFWELHDPTTHMRQGNDAGTQYRSGIYYTSESQRVEADETKQLYENALGRTIVTEIEPLKNFYPAEEYHQQYDLKPGSRQYCGLRPTGVTLPEA